MKTCVSLFTLSLLALMPVYIVKAQTTISHQGIVTNTDGTLVDDGTLTLTFRLYDAEAGGNTLWTETQDNVEVTNGLFSVQLGRVESLNELPFDQPYFLSIALGDDAVPELTPRLPLTAVPYALRAQALNDGAIEAGDNVTITREGNALRITAAGDDSGGDITSVIAGDGLTGGSEIGAADLALDIRFTDTRYVNEGQASGVTTPMLADSAVTLSKIDASAGSPNQVLTVEDGAATWKAIPSSPAESLVNAEGTTVVSSDGDDLVISTETKIADNLTVSKDALARVLVESTSDSFSSIRLQGSTSANAAEIWVDFAAKNFNLKAIGTTERLRLMGSNNQGLFINNQGNVVIGSDTFGEKLSVAGVIESTEGGIKFPDGTVQTSAASSDGTNNTSEGENAVVGGGANNSASGSRSTIGGGLNNDASGDKTTIAGGQGNEATANLATISGGFANDATGIASFIGGGQINEASGFESAVVAGQENEALGQRATVLSGNKNVAGGSFSVVLGGIESEALGNLSLAFGQKVKIDAAHNGAMLFGDTTNDNFTSSAANEFAVRASGGVRLLSSSDGASGVRLPAGGSTWQALSDRNAKEHFAPVDAAEVLNRVAALPMATWNYKTQDDTIRHMGPMAQDFHAAFGLGSSNRHITTIDADGVALAAIQGLYAVVQAQQSTIESLQTELMELRTLIDQRLAKAE